MEKRFLCGASKRIITPPADFFPYEGPVGRIVNGIADDLYVRVIALDTAISKLLLVSFDMIAAPMPEIIVPLLTEKTAIPEENILYTGTHAHATVTPRLSENAPQKLLDYIEVVKKAAVEAALEALNAMKPARLGFGHGNSYINVNRNQVYYVRDEENHVVDQYCLLGQRWDGPSDKTVALVRFEDLQGVPIAFFMNYAVHCNTMYGNALCGDMAVSGDIAGLTSQYMEARFKNSVAMWTAGAAGDQGAVTMNHTYFPDPKSGHYYETTVTGGDYENIRALAARHFDDILLINDKIVCNQSQPAIKTAVGMSLTPGRDVIITTDEDPEGVCYPDVKILWAEYAKGNYMPPVKYRDSRDPYKVRVQLIRLGEIAFLGFSGELYSSLGTFLKEISPVKNTVIVTHASSNMIGSKYIYDDEGCTIGGNGGLQYYASRLKPGYIKKSLETVVLDLFRLTED